MYIIAATTETVYESSMTNDHKQLQIVYSTSTSVGPEGGKCVQCVPHQDVITLFCKSYVLR